MGLFGGKKSERRSLNASSASPLLVNGAQGDRVAVDTAIGVADVFACVRAISEAAATLPLHAFRADPRGDRVRVRRGRTVDILDRPAPGVTRSAFVGTVVAHLAAHGNAYIAKYRGDGNVEQVAPVDPRNVTVKVAGGRPVYEVATTEGVRKLGTDDILHVRMPLSLDGVTGLSPIAAVRETIATADTMARTAGSFVRNQLRPSGIVRVPAATSNDQAAALRATLQGMHAPAATRGGQIMLISGEADWTPLSLSAVDAEFVAQRQLSTAEIARIFRVPPWVIGAPSGDSMTYSNVSEQSAAFIRHTLAPYLVAVEEGITGDRDLAPGSVFVEFELSGFLRADAKTRAEVYALALDPATGWMNRAEVRRLENLPDDQEAMA